MFAAHQSVLKTQATKRIGPFAVPKCMSSTISANLSTAYKIKGINYSITSACSTSLHCIGAAAEQIQFGKQDVMFAGGAEELDWTLSCLFDAMGAMSSNFNDTPARASRAFDADRDGFVIGGGGAILVLEELGRAQARARRSMPRSPALPRPPMAMTWSRPRAKVAHGRWRWRWKHYPKTPRQLHQRAWYLHAGGRCGGSGGGATRLQRRVATSCFLDKSMTGHAQGAAGALEAVFCLLMLEQDFIAPSINVEALIPGWSPARLQPRSWRTRVSTR